MIARFWIAVTVLLASFTPAAAAVDIVEVTSPKGIRAWLVEEHSIPFAAIEIRFEGGTSVDPAGKRGAVNLMTALIEEGSGEMDAQAFARAKEELATSIGFDVFDDALSVSFRFLTENREGSVALLKQALTDPVFADDAVERVRQQVLANIRSKSTDPNEIARETFASLAWGDHPYATSGDGTIESVSALTRDDMFEAFRLAIARDRVYVGAVGDITPEELSALLDEVLGGLPETGAPPVPDAEYQLEPGVTVIPFDTPQAVTLFGHEGIPRNDDDFFAAYLANEIFGGGGFGSRLTEEVRVKRGLTYGIGAYLAPRDHGALIIGQAATENGRMPETVDVVRDEWARVSKGDLSETEIREAKLYLTGAYPLRFDGNATIARIMVGMQMENLPIDYIATRNDKVEAITPDEANAVARRIYRPEDLHFVIVGKPGDVDVGN